MPRSSHKCARCGKSAIAYQQESDGTRVFLCPEHIPIEEHNALPEIRFPAKSKPTGGSKKPED
jgi:hypothetical protein